MTVALALSMAAGAPPAGADDRCVLRPGDVVAFAGGANFLRAQEAGYLQALLSYRFAAERPVFRDLTWEGDTVLRQGTVIERWRKGPLGDWGGQLDRVGATVVLMQFGQVEVLEGIGPEAFSEAYGRLLDATLGQGKRRVVVLLAPTPFESSGDPLLPDLAARNRELATLVEAARRLAGERGLPFVDCFTALGAGEGARGGGARLTFDGIHLNGAGQRAVALEVARELGWFEGGGGGGVRMPSWEALAPLRAAAVEQHRLWYDSWRPANWKCLYGDDGNRIFSRAAVGLPSFREEMARFPALVAAADQRVWETAATLRAGGEPGEE